MRNVRGQITIFIILAIIIVAIVITFFIFRGRVNIGGIPTNLEPAYNYFLTCLEDEVLTGASILGAQGGYIELPEFEPGSPYAPTSSQLDFLGVGVLYWYYISGNGIQKQQVPLLNDMEGGLEDYLEKNILDCSFDSFYEQGFEVATENPNAKVTIRGKEIAVDLNMDIALKKNEDMVLIKKHSVLVKSSLGDFYDTARKIYDSERNNNFLEDYGVDVLRLYAPVDGVEISCSPLVWVQEEIKKDLRDALEANIRTIKIDGDYYKLSSDENKYFVTDVGKKINNANVNFLYSSNWPTKIEVYPDEKVLIAGPVGNQPGLGALGFCYVPYHFVYDLNYPVLIQIYNQEEMFQFPVAVIINRNKAIQGGIGKEIPDAVPELCKYMNQEIEVYSYNTNLEPVDADIDFECLGARCDVGESLNGYLEAEFPQCYNGYIVAEAEGYVRKRNLYSTNSQSGEVNIILEKLYELQVNLKVDGRASSDKAIINFISKDVSDTIVWPEQNTIELAEGNYNVSVYIYKDSKIILPGIDEEICNEVPREGLLGILGMTKEKCFKVEIPGQELGSIIFGGGKSSDYLIESQLQSRRVEISVNSFALPKNIEDLQDSYNLIEVSPVYLEFG